MVAAVILGVVSTFSVWTDPLRRSGPVTQNDGALAPAQEAHFRVSIDGMLVIPFNSSRSMIPSQECDS
jgi:hypothetical protein